MSKPNWPVSCYIEVEDSPMAEATVQENWDQAMAWALDKMRMYRCVPGTKKLEFKELRAR